MYIVYMYIIKNVEMNWVKVKVKECYTIQILLKILIIAMMIT